MSGFFATLLSRSRGTADVVRPRLASLFEPGAQRPSPEAGASPADAQVVPAHAEPVPISASPAHRLALSRDARSSRSASHPPHGHDSPSDGDRHLVTDSATDDSGTHGRGESWDTGDEADAFAGATRRSARADGGAARGPRQRGNHGAHADRADRPAAAAAAGVSTAFAAAHGDDLDSMPGAGALSASAVRAALAQARATGAADGMSHGSRGTSGAYLDAAASDPSLTAGTMPAAALIAAARPPSSLAPLPVPSSSSRRHADAAASRSRADANAGEPVIEISIGRIDVRAAVDRGSDRRTSARPSSVMGLEEYLETRARARGGSR